MDPEDQIVGEPTAEAVDTSPVDGAVPGEAGEHQEPEQGVLSTFKLEDVPEEYREHVNLYVKQANGDYTRKTQALAEQRKELAARQEQADLIAALDAEETREEALRELLERYDYEFATDEESAENAEDEDEEDFFRDPRVDELLDAREREQRDADQRRQEEERRAYEDTVLAHAQQELDSWAKKLGVEKVDDEDRTLAYSIAANLPLGEDGMPDVAGAIARIEARDAGRIQAYLRSKKPDIQAPDLSGLSGQPTFDPRDTKARLAAMNAVAERAIARHA